MRIIIMLQLKKQNVIEVIKRNRTKENHVNFLYKMGTHTFNLYSQKITLVL